MENKNSEILFEYLRSILYDTKTIELNIDALDESFRKLGRGMQYLDQAVQEMKSYTADLSIGNLSGHYPGRDNFLCENLKNLHANLNHLTWQAKQVASGDYSQHVSYLGEFSEAFNTMTGQLCERERMLKQDAEKEKKRAAMMEGYHELLLEMMHRSHEHILVLDEDTKEIVYGNRQGEPDVESCNIGFEELDEVEQIIVAKNDIEEKIWEAEDSQGRSYRIMTALIEWQGHRAHAHIIRDITEERQREEKLADQAYTDSLTNIGNRFYFNEQMKRLLDRKLSFVLCYFDLDHLKYINDRFGHAEGDVYLCTFASAVKNRIRENDIFARIGGGEFCAVFEECPKKVAEQKLEKILCGFSDMHIEKYPASFSYGTVEVKAYDENLSISDILKCADDEMYVQKKIHRQKYKEKIRD